jgi:SAM-dependent methyltransferase
MMQSEPYAAIAEAYARHWGPSSAAMMLPVLKIVLLPRLPPQARILDLCCGTGDVASQLEGLGYRVAAVDGTAELIEVARRQHSRVQFEVSTAQAFRRPDSFDGVICLYDSLNHMASLDELTTVFGNCFASLAPGGWFLFDLNDEAGFEARWRGEFSIIEPDLVLIARSKYSKSEQKGRMDVTLFREQASIWQRRDVRFEELCFQTGDVTRQLESAGFVGIELRSAQLDFDLRREVGRTFFMCKKPA